MWKWIWPSVGAVPVSQDLNTEMFDRQDYPYSETFVREAIQNSLDARLDSSKPVVVGFKFHAANLGARRPYLEQLRASRTKAHLSWPDEWDRNRITWLTVEDFNARGLSGNLLDRMSDFWNYWLNFGLSNKDGSGRGGRGIGRVTFLIASQIQTVLGFTRRFPDGSSACCGMSVLRAQKDGDDFLSTHAYLAEAVHRSIYKLHSTQQFEAGFKEAFCLAGYAGDNDSGFALVVPYPHEDLKPAGILAAAIEHFAPAIMNGSLIVSVDDRSLNTETIRSIAISVSTSIRASSISRDVTRYLDLIDYALTGPLVPVSVTSLKEPFEGHRGTEVVKSLQVALLKAAPAGIRLDFPLKWDDQIRTVELRAAVARSSPDRQPIDRLFREGMSLPDVKAKMPGELDLVILVDETTLAMYLNLCEGKAHLDLLEPKEAKGKLKEAGFDPNFTAKRFVKALPMELRQLLTPEVVEPDSTVFDEFFSVSVEGSGNGLSRRKKKDEQEEQKEQELLPPPRISALVLDPIPGGFRLRANPKFATWPVSASITIAYANGGRSLSWSEYDFRLNELKISHENCKIELAKNKILAKDCGKNARIEVTGFGSTRELDTRLRWWTHAA
jgi:hypothetical protein